MKQALRLMKHGHMDKVISTTKVNILGLCTTAMTKELETNLNVCSEPSWAWNRPWLDVTSLSLFMFENFPFFRKKNERKEKKKWEIIKKSKRIPTMLSIWTVTLITLCSYSNFLSKAKERLSALLLRSQDWRHVSLTLLKVYENIWILKCHWFLRSQLSPLL